MDGSVDAEQNVVQNTDDNQLNEESMQDQPTVVIETSMDEKDCAAQYRQLNDEEEEIKPELFTQLFDELIEIRSGRKHI